MQQGNTKPYDADNFKIYLPTFLFTFLFALFIFPIFYFYFRLSLLHFLMLKFLFYFFLYFYKDIYLQFVNRKSLSTCSSVSCTSLSLFLSSLRVFEYLLMSLFLVSCCVQLNEKGCLRFHEMEWWGFDGNVSSEKNNKRT